MSISMYSTIIIGGGVAGTSTAYQMYKLKNFNKKVLLIEAGSIGEGSWEKLPTKSNFKYTSVNEPETFYPWLSGTNVLDLPNRIKMIITVVPISAIEFAKHHGKEGISLFNKLSILGRDEQFRLADLYLNKNKEDISNKNVNEISDNLTHMKLGSLMVCKSDEVDDFYEDYKLLKECGYEVDWWDKEKVEKMHGKDFDYHSGMFFPKDGAIFSVKYSKTLAEEAKKKGLEIRENTLVKKIIEEQKDGKKIVKVVLENETLFSEKVIMCTGGFYMDEYLGGILKPVYSYLTGIKAPVDYSNAEGNTISTMKNTPNFLTHNFLCDWNMSQGWLRISGEDHYSSQLYPRTNHRGKEMEEWLKKRYPYLRNAKEVKYINGVCSEVADFLPLLGNAFEGSNVYYNLGCNGWGQAILSAMAILVTGVIGERELSKEEKELVNFIDIKRFRLGNERKKLPKF